VCGADCRAEREEREERERGFGADNASLPYQGCYTIYPSATHINIITRNSNIVYTTTYVLIIRFYKYIVHLSKTVMSPENSANLEIPNWIRLKF